MIIKTITCQKVNNHGATLQAYALMHYLESLGNDVEIIDYVPERFNHFRPFVCSTEKYAKNFFLKTAYICAKFPSRFAEYLKYKNSLRKTNFENFWNKYYYLTKCYKTFDELKNNPPEADLYIAGSDQIWNTMMENGKDPAYYLQFVKNGIRATYAASFSVSEIPDELKNQTKAFIESIDYVSVREKSALKILDDLGIKDACVVLDPVFLLSREEWDCVESKMEFDDKYILVYDFENSDSVKSFSLQYAKENKVKIYSLYNSDYCDKCFEDYGPDVFLSLIKNADFVVSNSFHATAFSVIYEKQFAVIEREEGINSRMVDLLDEFGIEGHIVTEYQLMNKIDYYSVNEKKDKVVESSKEYLLKLLENVKK